MTIQATGTIEAKSWEEQPFSEAGRTLSRVVARNRFTGDVDGDGTLGYLLTYIDEKTGTSIGYEQVTATVAGRTGGFVLEHRGTFTADGVEIGLEVVAGSGTGDLAGIHGSGGFAATFDGKPSPYTLSLQLA